MRHSGGPFCTYPWYAFNGTDIAFTYGGDYRGTQFDYHQSAQFATTPLGPGGFGPVTTYCDTVLSSTRDLRGRSRRMAHSGTASLERWLPAVDALRK